MKTSLTGSATAAVIALSATLPSLSGCSGPQRSEADTQSIAATPYTPSFLAESVLKKVDNLDVVLVLIDKLRNDYGALISTYSLINRDFREVYADAVAHLKALKVEAKQLRESVQVADRSQDTDGIMRSHDRTVEILEAIKEVMNAATAEKPDKNWTPPQEFGYLTRLTGSSATSQSKKAPSQDQ